MSEVAAGCSPQAYTKHKHMKKLLIGTSLASALILAACLAPVTMVSTGCSTVSTNSPSTNDQQVINATALILRSAARDGALYAIQTDPGTKQYFVLSVNVLSTFLTGKDYTPGAFQTALMGVGSPAMTNIWVQIGIGTVIDLYQLYYGQYVKNAVNGNLIAQAFITAVQDGLNQALGNPVTATQYYKGGRLGAARPQAILPRPIKR